MGFGDFLKKGINPMIASVVDAAGNIFGARESAKATREANELNANLQREFAQHGLRWKVEDGVRAGLHPLVAAGAQTYGASPSYVGDSSMGEAFARTGQNISRAISATRTETERRIAALSVASAELEVEGRSIDNAIRSYELSRLMDGSPAFPGDANFIPGQGNSGLVTDKPLERVVSQPGRFAQEAGWVPDVAYSRTDSGMVPVIPRGLAESMESDPLGTILWRIRNQLAPNFTGKGHPPASQLPPGYNGWRWDYTGQEWRPVKEVKPLRKRIKEFMFGDPFRLRR